MRFTKTLAIALASLWLVQGTAFGVTIDVSNLTNTPTGKTSYSPSNNLYMATMLRTSTFAGTSSPIQSITLRLQNESGVSITNAQVFIYSSTVSNIVSQRRPQAQIPNAVFNGNIGVANPNGSGSLTYQDVKFDATASITLNPDTSYWIVFMSTPTTQVNWLNYNTASNVVGTNVLINTFSATSPSGADGSWTNFAASPNQFEITTVPEPSTYALAALSVCLLGVCGRKRRARFGN